MAKSSWFLGRRGLNESTRQGGFKSGGREQSFHGNPGRSGPIGLKGAFTLIRGMTSGFAFACSAWPGIQTRGTPSKIVHETGFWPSGQSGFRVLAAEPSKGANPKKDLVTVKRTETLITPATCPFANRSSFELPTAAGARVCPRPPQCPVLDSQALKS